MIHSLSVEKHHEYKVYPWFLFCVAILNLQCSFTTADYVHPEQVHISFGDSDGKMWITWVTFNQTNGSYVEYGLQKLTASATGNSTLFVDDGPEKRHIYIHRVQIDDLLPETLYFYHCGSMDGWSAVFHFKTHPQGTNWSPSIAVFGDMGVQNAQSLPYLSREAHDNTYDAIFHVGDFAYDMQNDNARVGDQFMRQIESIAAHLPYMTVPGNHEAYYNFSNYKNRFTMPNSVQSLYYSFDLGPAHFIGYTSEPYFFGSAIEVENQYRWLKRDIAVANANRAQRPWVIAMGHRPYYCSDWDGDDCSRFESILRRGINVNGTFMFGLDDLFFNSGIDLVLQAHEHSYERLLPLYDRTIYLGKNSAYDSPCAPVHIISGSAGCKERTDIFHPHPMPWSVFRSTEYGYGRLKVYNGTHLSFEQVSIDQFGKVIDNIWLKQEHHGPFDITKCAAVLTNTPAEKPPLVDIRKYFSKKTLIDKP